jgi:SM-20-related protein
VFNSLLLDMFLGTSTRQEILRELESAGSARAKVYGPQPGGGVDARVRSADRLAVSSTIRELVMDSLLKAQGTIEHHFGITFTSCEEPQFLRYRTGDFFVAHQDGNTALIRDESTHRRISVVVFLNSTSIEPREGTYGGGSLVFHGRYPDFDQRYVVPATAGALIAFPSETTHEVTPVTHGERYTIVSWYRQDRRPQRRREKIDERFRMRRV